MRRLVVLTVLLLAAAWFAREGRWLSLWPAPPVTTPHDAYRRVLEHTGVTATPLGRAWLAASASAVATAAPVTLPARRTFTFTDNTPDAWGFRVQLKRGQRVEVVATTVSSAPAQAFVDVFAREAEAGKQSDTAPDHQRGALRGLDYEAGTDREVIVRVQPELLRTGRLDVSLRVAPALRFPVATGRPRDVQSIFGDARDAGRRQHEGVDIFAARGTNVISATDGVVLRVGETGLGGRVVWVWNIERGLRLYYAHLDRQLVTSGQRVTVGEVLGTVGNTGNARTTAPHLHFGIYERGTGAIDPYWFIALPPARGAIATR